MRSDEEPEIVRYVTPPAALSVVGIVFFLISPALWFVLNLIPNKPLLPWVAGIVTAVMGLVFFFLRFYYFAEAKSVIRSAKNSGSEGKLLHDFRNGQRLFGERLIMGERYIFSKGMGGIVYCPDIREIHTEVKLIKLKPYAINVTVIQNKGKKLTLCSLPYSDNGDNKARAVVEMVSKRSPDTRIKFSKLA